MRGAELTIDSDRVSSSDVFDLHAPHQRSYATDFTTLPYVPLSWRPFNDHIVQVQTSCCVQPACANATASGAHNVCAPQIPYTFPVRVRGAPKPSKTQSETTRQRRIRKLFPSAWAKLGVGGDWDSVQGDGGIIGRDYADEL